jgi:hypothetical protein
MSGDPAPVDINYQRVLHLLELLRKRTPEELVVGGLVFAPAFTPEMRQALMLLQLERSADSFVRLKSHAETPANLRT